MLLDKHTRTPLRQHRDVFQHQTSPSSSVSALKADDVLILRWAAYKNKLYVTKRRRWTWFSSDTNFRTKRPKEFNGRASLGSIKPPEVLSSSSEKTGKTRGRRRVPRNAHDTWSFQLNAAHSVKMHLEPVLNRFKSSMQSSHLKVHLLAFFLELSSRTRDVSVTKDSYCGHMTGSEQTKLQKKPVYTSHHLKFTNTLQLNDERVKVFISLKKTNSSTNSPNLPSSSKFQDLTRELEGKWRICGTFNDIGG